MTGLDLAFALLSLPVALMAVLAVTSARVVHAALALIGALGLIAAVYAVLGAPILAMVQLLIYVGAVVVLVVFALMVTQAPSEPSPTASGPAGRRVAAAAAGLGVTGMLCWAILPAVDERTVTITSLGSTPVGKALFSTWALPFEALSVLLLAALAAAVVLSSDRGQR